MYRTRNNIITSSRDEKKNVAAARTLRQSLTRTVHTSRTEFVKCKRSGICVVDGVEIYSLSLAALGSQRKWEIHRISSLHPVSVTAPCKAQVPREARRLRGPPLRRLSTSNQRLQRLEVYSVSVSVSRHEWGKRESES